MYLIVIAWLYVTLMMAIAETASPSGTLLGALVILLFYAAIPLSLLLYCYVRILRKRNSRRSAAQGTTVNPDAGGEAPAAAQTGSVAPVGKEP